MSPPSTAPTAMCVRIGSAKLRTRALMAHPLALELPPGVAEHLFQRRDVPSRDRSDLALRIASTPTTFAIVSAVTIPSYVLAHDAPFREL